MVLELVKQAIRSIMKLLFYCFYNLNLPPQSVKTQSLRPVTTPCATLTLDFRCTPFSFPMRHIALSLLSSSSLRTGSAVPHRPFRCLFFPLLVQTADYSPCFYSLQSKAFHGINTLSLKFCLQGCFCFVSSIQNKNLEKNKDNNTIALEKMEGHQTGSSCLHVMAFKTLLLNRTKALLSLLITPSVLGKLREGLSRK